MLMNLRKFMKLKIYDTLESHRRFEFHAKEFLVIFCNSFLFTDRIRTKKFLMELLMFPNHITMDLIWVLYQFLFPTATIKYLVKGILRKNNSTDLQFRGICSIMMARPDGKLGIDWSHCAQCWEARERTPNDAQQKP